MTTSDTFGKFLKIATSITALFMLASALLWITVQHTAYIQAQTNAANLQTAAMTTLAQVNAERLEINRQMWSGQQQILKALERIEKKQQSKANDQLCCRS